MHLFLRLIKLAQMIWNSPTTIQKFLTLKLLQVEKRMPVMESMKLLNPDIFPNNTLEDCPSTTDNKLACVFKYVYLILFYLQITFQS